MQLSIAAWIVLGVIAATLERMILPRPEGQTFLGSLVLAWVGAALGELISVLLGFGALTEFNVRSVGFAVLGILFILGGFRWVRRRGRA